MKSSYPQKSALKSGIEKTEEKGKLTFIKSKVPRPYSLDYGVLRVHPRRGMTPYPRPNPPVDADTLRERLNSQQFSAKELYISEVDDECHAQVIAPAISTKHDRENRQIVLAGTPHPKKALAINPQELIKHIDESTTSILSRESSSTWTSINFDNSSPPRKLEKRLRTVTMGTVTSHKKKVEIISPSPSARHLPDRNTRSDHSYQPDTKMAHSYQPDAEMADISPKVSFEERRRLFHIGEFTIAKNGRKMSETPILDPVCTDFVEPSIYHIDLNAKRDFDNYVRREGTLNSSINLPDGKFQPPRNSIFSPLQLRPFIKPKAPISILKQTSNNIDHKH